MLTCLAVVAGGSSNLWLDIPGRPGPGAGKTMVLVSGDEEYRSEEAMPMLAKILAQRHGFRCIVLFAIDAVTGEINPNTLDNIPGLHLLAEAELMVVFTRFRELPDDQMRHVHEYLELGKPVIGIRPSVVAFRNRPESRYFRYSANYKAEDYAGGFGRQILGSTWISHHGRHGQESTRGVPVEAEQNHSILRGVDVMWGPSDVYTILSPIPHGGRVLVMGQVLSGMTPTNSPSAKPMMPLAWTKHYPSTMGQGRVFMTTMGASQDFEDESFRRMLVNACYWATSIEDRIPLRANVDFVGSYHPKPFGFDGFERGLTPIDFGVESKHN